MTVSATTSTPRRRPSQPTATRVRPCRLGDRAALPGAAALATRRQPRAGRPRRRVRRRRPDAEPRWSVKSSTAGSAPRRSGAAAAIAAPIGCSEACSTAPAQAQHRRRRSRLGRDARRPRVIRPVVTVPVLSSTMVSTRRVDSSTSGPLIRMPSWAPRPVPTSSAVGVARPSAHGQAMISTATAAVNARRCRCAGGQPARRASPPTGRSRRARTPPDTRSARRCTAALPVCASVDQPGHLRQLGVGADAGRAHDQAAAGVDRGADDGVAGADLDRDRLAGEHATRRRPSVPVDDDAVGGDLLARPHDEPVADGAAAPIGTRSSLPPSSQHARRPWRPAPAAPAAPRRPGAWLAPRSSGRRG